MRPRIAIPVPHSGKPEYNQRSLPQYEQALLAEGADPVRIPLDSPPSEVARLVTSCQGVLLPGSPADVDPQKFGAVRHAKTSPADSLRDNADELLLQDAHNLHKPLFGICYGLQSLNVWRTGSLLQHIENTPINHEAGKAVPVAHQVDVAGGTLLADILGAPQGHVPVNSSHHQSVEQIGDGLRISARCAEDGIVEAIEGTQPGHFVLAVQWHPERSYPDDTYSRALFHAFVEAARQWKPREVTESVAG
jgi:putative glutamine amidotransferase